MKFWPFRTFIFKSPLTQDEIIERLRRDVDIDRLVRLKGYKGLKYQGNIQKRSFDISRALYGTSSMYSTRMKGRIKQKRDCSLIQIKARLKPLHLLIYFGFGINSIVLLISFLVGSIYWVLAEGEHPLVLLINLLPLIFFVIWRYFLHGSYETSISDFKEYMWKLLEAKELTIWICNPFKIQN